MRRSLWLAFAAACHATPSGAPVIDSAAPAPDGTVDAALDATGHGMYPLVLAHGMFGFVNIGPLDYFYGIAPVLQAQGRTVLATAVDPLQSSSVRGQQLDDQVHDLLAQTGADKVVIIGHSQGGLDARWVASHDPSVVAAVITVATPHLGSPVADVATGALPGDADAALDALATLFGVSDASLEGALQDLTSAGAASFNALTPDSPGVMYWSVAGRSNGAGYADCPPSSKITQDWDSSTDSLNPLLAIPEGILAANVPSDTVQDGLVTLASAQWGRFLGCVPADHLDEVCQVAGESPGLDNSFDCLKLYENLGSMLTENGF